MPVIDIPCSPIVAIADSGNQILALRADGTLYAWAGNGSRQADVANRPPQTWPRE